MCKCGVKLRPGDSVAWCYAESCPHTTQRFPTPGQIQELKIEPTTLGRPSWTPGMKPHREDA